MSSIEPPLCVALDVGDLDAAQDVLEELSGLVPMFKVGLELFCAEGPRTVDVVHSSGARVFLDLKVNDIPRTAAAAVREAGRIGADFLTIHGFGGREMIRAAAETAADRGGPELLVVSSLTSLDDEALRDLGVVRGVREQALALGRLAADEGAGGLILSPRELEVVRSALPHLFLATPGVRPLGTSDDDHKRVLTPAEAILDGADLVVVGRPILLASDRRRAAEDLIRELGEAEAQRESHLAADDAQTPYHETEDADLDEEVDV